MKEILADPIDDEELHWMLDAGAHVRRDYSSYFQKHCAPTRYSPRPRLVGLTKGEAWANPGSYLSSFFVHTPPRFHFNRSEQLLLHHALNGRDFRRLGRIVIHFSLDGEEALASDLPAGRGRRSTNCCCRRSPTAPDVDGPRRGT